MSSQPAAFFAVDLGSATTSGAVLGHIGGRWRLVAHATAPSWMHIDTVLTGLLDQTWRADSRILTELGAAKRPNIPALVSSWPRLVAQTTPRRRIAVLAGSRRQRRRLETAALRAGWLVVGGSADENDPVALSRLMLSAETSAVLIGADSSSGGDEKRSLPDLVAMVAAATLSRPELTVVLAGGAAAYESAFAGRPRALSSESPAFAVDRQHRVGGPGPGPGESMVEKDAGQTKKASRKASAPDVSERVEDAAPRAGEAAGAGKAAAADGPATAPSPAPLAFAVVEAPVAPQHVLLAPDAEAGDPAGASLQQVLEGLRTVPNDSRLGVIRSIASLAYVLDRSIEVVEVGMQGGLISRSEPFGQGHDTIVTSSACLADGSFAPEDPSEEVIDGVLSWTTVVLDRHRAMDRLNDLRLVPWGEADGDGAVFRLAAAKAAFGRLIEAMPELTSNPLPELLIAGGGVFSALPPSAVALAMADLMRRPGVSMLAVDQARLLGPLGVIEDESERRRLMANLADDILMPLGSLILPAGVRQGRSAGSANLKGTTSVSEIELHPGALQVVDLPPGRSGRADLDFRDPVRLDKRGRHFSVDVGGGLCGLLIDLRDIPMRISERPESRRAALDAWQRGMWPEVDK